MCVPSWTGNSATLSGLGEICLPTSSCQGDAPRLHRATHSHAVFLPQGLALKHTFTQTFPHSKENFHISLLSESSDRLLLLMEGTSTHYMVLRLFPVLSRAPCTRPSSRLLSPDLSSSHSSSWESLSRSLLHTLEDPMQTPDPFNQSESLPPLFPLPAAPPASFSSCYRPPCEGHAHSIWPSLPSPLPQWRVWETFVLVPTLPLNGLATLPISPSFSAL